MLLPVSSEGVYLSDNVGVYLSDDVGGTCPVGVQIAVVLFAPGTKKISGFITKRAKAARVRTWKSL